MNNHKQNDSYYLDEPGIYIANILLEDWVLRDPPPPSPSKKKKIIIHITEHFTILQLYTTLRLNTLLKLKKLEANVSAMIRL